MATKSNFMGYTRGVPVFSDSNEIISTNPLYISFVGTSKTLNARSPVPMCWLIVVLMNLEQFRINYM